MHFCITVHHIMKNIELNKLNMVSGKGPLRSPDRHCKFGVCPFKVVLIKPLCCNLANSLSAPESDPVTGNWNWNPIHLFKFFPAFLYCSLLFCTFSSQS